MNHCRPPPKSFQPTLGAADAGQAIHVVQNWFEEFRNRE